MVPEESDKQHVTVQAPSNLLLGIDNLALSLEDELNSQASMSHSHSSPLPPAAPSTRECSPSSSRTSTPLSTTINLQRSQSVCSSSSSSSSTHSLSHISGHPRRTPLLKSSYSCREVVVTNHTKAKPHAPPSHHWNNNNNESDEVVEVNQANQADGHKTTRCIEIARDVLDLETFGHKAGLVMFDDEKDQNTIKNKLNESVRSSIEDLVTCRCLSSLFPILEWLPRYSVRNNLLSDIMAGITIAILHIPQGIAYSLLAGLGPVNGLYVSLYPVLIYTFMGTSRHISIGTFAIASIMLNSIAVKNGAVSATEARGNNTALLSSTSIMPPTTLEVLTSVCLLCGFIQIGMGFLRLGSLSKILSEHLVSAFSTAIAFHVATSQLTSIFGLTRLPRVPGGAFKLIRTWIFIAENMDKANLNTLVVSAMMIITLVAFKELIEPRLKKKCSYPIPIDLLLVVLSVLISWLGKLNKTFSIEVVEDVPTGLPQPSLPRVDLMPSLFMDSLILSIVCFAVSLSLAKIFAKKHAYTVRPNQELLALGTANVLSSFFLCYPSSAALSRSTLQERVGGKTQLAGLVSCVILLTVLLFLAPFLYHLPKCTLSCIILVALKTMFMQIAEFATFWRISKLDGLAWLITFIAVLVLDIDLGLIVGVSVSILTLIIRLARPKIYTLGQLSTTEIYAEEEAYRNLNNYPGVRIVRIGSPLFYLNVDTFKDRITNTIESFEPSDGRRGSRTLILDLSGVSFIDKTGIDSLVDVVRTLQCHKICASFVSCPYHVIASFETIYFGDQVKNALFPFKIYPTIHDAVIDSL